MQDKFDFFLAHASTDLEAATVLFNVIDSSEIKGFFSPKTNKISQDWYARTPSAHSRSAATVILLSPETEKAVYQRDEILRAIEYSRKGIHKIFTIYWNGAKPISEVDYGLSNTVHRVAENINDLKKFGTEIQRHLIDLKFTLRQEATLESSLEAKKDNEAAQIRKEVQFKTLSYQHNGNAVTTIDDMLAKLSNEFIQRHLTLGDASLHGELRRELCRCLQIGGKENEEDLISIIGKKFSEKSNSRANELLNAYSGSGREQVIALLYLDIFARCAKKQRFIPVIFDWKLQNTNWRLPPEVRDALASPFRRADQKQFILLVVGSKRTGGSSPGTNDDLERLFKFLQGNESIKLSATWQRTWARPTDDTGSERILTIKAWESNSVDINRLIRLASLIDGIQLENSVKDAACERLLAICRRHRLAPDVFIARRVLASVRSGSGSHISLATLIEEFVTDIIRSQTEDVASGGSTASIVSSTIRRYSRLQYKKYMNGLATEPDNAHFALIRTHQSIRFWLIAHELFRSFAEAEEADAIALFEFQERFDHVFPSQITAYFRDFLEHADSSTVRAALRTVHSNLQLISHGSSKSPLNVSSCGLNVRFRKFASTCIYLAGRVKTPSLQREMKELLSKISILAEADLQDFRRVRPMISAGNQIKSEAIKLWWRNIFVLLGEPEDRSDGDLQVILTRLEREILLLQRGIFISQAMLRDDEAARDYISKLMTSYADDDLNRGFHREYYGDIQFESFKPLLSDDASLGTCRRTLQALMTEIPMHEANAPMAQIQLYTVASLVRPRNLEKGKQYDDVAQFLREEVLRHGRFNDQLRSFVEVTIAEIEYGQYALEAYIDDLYEIKFQSRAGWMSIKPSESVAAHQYMVERLAELFVHTTTSNKNVDKQRVLALVRMHDIGEAITSDIPSPRKTREDEINEDAIVRRISLIGALTGSNEFLRLFDEFQEFEQIRKYRSDHVPDRAVVIANDLDRLDLLIQCHRYIRENGSIDNQSVFLDSVSVEKFSDKEIRKRAQRFTDYFASERSVRTSCSRYASGLWPSGVPKSRRVGEADACSER